MKRFLLLVLAICVVFVVQAQRVYFMYLQSENATPFFVKMGDKVYSSTASGYVILSNLKDSTYNFSVGFPGGKTSETRFGVTISQADRGFLLKHFEEGLALFDLQSLGLIKAMAMAGVPENVQVVARTDAFTRHLSEAADDESLLYATVAVKREEPKKEVQPEPKADVAVQPKLEPKTDIVTVADTGSAKAEAEKPVTATVKASEPPVKEEARADTLVAVAPIKAEEKKDEVKAEVVKAEVATDTVTAQPAQPVAIASQPEAPKVEAEKSEPAAPYKRSVVTKRSESSTTEGFGVVYLDRQEEDVDTIRLLIPNPRKPVVAQETVKEQEVQKLEEPVKTELQAKVEVKKEEEAKADRKVAVEEEEPKESRKTLKDIASGLFKAPRQEAEVLKVENANCTALATDRDFIRVRRNMAAESNDERMIEEAKVFFRSRCFTTDQIKNLSGLFVTSAAKYQFFDAAYKHVTDPSAFPALESEIKDPYYLKRFKALIGE